MTWHNLAMDYVQRLLTVVGAGAVLGAMLWGLEELGLSGPAWLVVGIAIGLGAWLYLLAKVRRLSVR